MSVAFTPTSTHQCLPWSPLDSFTETQALFDLTWGCICANFVHFYLLYFTFFDQELIVGPFRVSFVLQKFPH